MIPETKKKIDGMSYETMMAKWRFASVDDPMFQGEVGKYFSEVMKKKRSEISDEEHTAISKRLGW